MRVGFVGAGNMAGGLARGWAAARGEQGAPDEMLFADADPAKARPWRRRSAARRWRGMWLLPIAPTWSSSRSSRMSSTRSRPDLVQAGTPVLSILAGTTLKALHEALPGIDLVRVMPNLGAQVRQAVLCVVYGESTGETERRRIGELLGLVGDVIELDEGLIDAATAIMGCSPGYLALMAEVLVEAGVREGLTEDQALRMVARAMSATGRLLDLHDPTAL